MKDLTMNEKILIVEDELTLQETLAYNLKHEGYQVVTVTDGNQAVEKARQHKPNLIVLDIMLPGMDGFDVCRTLRKEMTEPILMLTARDDEIDRVVGLEVGADDYLTKPFSMREFLARVKALLRRVRLMKDAYAKQPTENDVMVFGDLVIDGIRHEVTLKNSVLNLQPREYDLLLLLAQMHGQTLSRESILQKVWGWEYFGDSRNVDVHIRWLREKIEEESSNPKRIVTVRGAGYRFEG